MAVQEYNETDVALYERLVCAAARENFWEYRKYVNPGMLEGWWQQLIAEQLQLFYERWLAGEKPVMILEAPPQHGKSKQVIDFMSWASGKNADIKSIYTSYSDDLGLYANSQLQRMYDSERYRKVFANTRLSSSHALSQGGRSARNSYQLEYVDAKGSFRNTTVMGQITGMGLDLGVVDDPIKGRKEAGSKVTRDATWLWLTDDFFSRFSENAALLMCMTRWHNDDPVGRFLEKYPEAMRVRYPALAEKDEKFRKKGEALFPELKSREFLLIRKKLYTIASWESLYQQNPSVVGGDMFPRTKFKIIPNKPIPKEIRRSVRYWDKAGTKDGGAYTVGTLMHEMRDDTFVVQDVVRGQWAALERETRILQTCQSDHADDRLVTTWVEQEPGSGGKESAERTVVMLRGFSCKADKVTGAKEIRAEPYAAQVQAGQVKLVAAEWNSVFLDEHEVFPNGKNKDQVDSAGGAFAKLTRTGSYDSTMSWVE